VPDRQDPIAALIPLFDDACECGDLIEVLAAPPEAVSLEQLRDLYLKSDVRANRCTQNTLRHGDAG
jgi:hypothetical protein